MGRRQWRGKEEEELAECTYIYIYIYNNMRAVIVLTHTRAQS